ncbi:MAG: hypothetical protein Kow009_01360 [Spirochaetales bacterium]
MRGAPIPYLVAFLFLLWVFSSCSSVDHFSEYTGVNLLEGKSLADWVPDYNEASTPAPANPEGGVYMLYESAGSTAGYGGGEAYRLRTKNLFPDGDFESGSIHSGWQPGGGASAPSLSGTDSISGNWALEYDLTSTSHYISFPLSNLTDEFQGDVPYSFRFDVKYTSGNKLIFDINTLSSEDKTNILNLQQPSEDTTIFSYPEDFPLSARIHEVYGQTSLYFLLNTVITTEADPQKGLIDNIRFLRSDLEYRIRLVLPRDDPDDPSRLPLPSGSYRFSFYVKQDPDAGSNNVFPASRISFGIDNAAHSVDASTIGSDWTQVEHTFTNIQIDPDSSIELWISATDSTEDFYRDCGSILISSPSLEFLPE